MKKSPNPEKKLVTCCPFCAGQLSISRLACDGCDTQIDSVVNIPRFFRLPADLQDFVMTFLRCQGKIRDVEKELEYPGQIKVTVIRESRSVDFAK